MRSRSKPLTARNDHLEGAEGLRFDSQGDRRGAAGAVSWVTTPLGLLCWPLFRVYENLARVYRTSLSLAVAVIGPGTGEGGAGW